LPYFLLKKQYLLDKTLLFLGMCFMCGMISVYIFGLPSLIGEITCGMILGPPLLNVIPFPEAMVLVGNIGLIGLMLEAGLGLDIANLKEVGTRAFVIGTIGTILPLIMGGVMGHFIWDLPISSSIAFGAIFSPTSFGVASIPLSSHDYLNTPLGGMIVAASVVDDVWGLSILSLIQVLVSDDARVIDYFIPFLSSFGFLIVLGYSAITWIPSLIEKKILSRVKHDANRNILACILMFLLMILYMPLLNYTKASYLTGIFLAGLSFSQIHPVPATFTENGRPMLNWFLRVFFAATIGFQVPVRLFTSADVLTNGLSLCKFKIE
jgi:Kef-type K+ transport system membrane component KefB